MVRSSTAATERLLLTVVSSSGVHCRDRPKRCSGRVVDLLRLLLLRLVARAEGLASLLHIAQVRHLQNLQWRCDRSALQLESHDAVEEHVRFVVTEPISPTSTTSSAETRMPRALCNPLAARTARGGRST